MNILEVDNLCKEYGEFRLDNISFSVPRGSIMGLIGENGAGKTTTINLILNEIKKDSGNIKIMDKDNLQYEIAVKDKIGVVFDECLFPDYFTASDIQKVMMNIYSAWDQRIFEEYIKRFDLPENKMIKNFSKGMKMKLMIAVAFSHNAEFLILDEATSGLDPVVRDQILDILIEFIQNKNCGVLFSSHIISDLEKAADYITFIHRGKIIFSKRKDMLLEEYGILSCEKGDFENLDLDNIVGYGQEGRDQKCLIKNLKEMQQKYPEFLIKPATIEEIMLFYIKGE